MHLCVNSLCLSTDSKHSHIVVEIFWVSLFESFNKHGISQTYHSVHLSSNVRVTQEPSLPRPDAGEPWRQFAVRHRTCRIRLFPHRELVRRCREGFFLQRWRICGVRISSSGLAGEITSSHYDHCNSFSYVSNIMITVRCSQKEEEFNKKGITSDSILMV